MIKIIVVLFVALLSVAYAVNVPSGAVLLTNPSNNHQWVYFGPSMAMNRANAAQACAAIGTKLADLADKNDFSYLAGQVGVASWINSWDGNTYDIGIAFYPGGAI